LRKKLAKITLLVFVLSLLAVSASADTQVDVYEGQKLVKSVVFKIGVKEYFVDNRVPGVPMDVAPFIENGRTYVPVRYLSNALGVTDKHIGWDERARLVTLAQPGFPKVELVINNRTIKSDGSPRQMDVAPVIRNARTFLPARFVAEALGYQVDWDPVRQVVVAWPKGEPKPDIGEVLKHLGENNNVAPPSNDPNKPAEVARLERVHGVTMTKTYTDGSRWDYAPSVKPLDRSHLDLTWYHSGSIWVNVSWNSILGDIRGVAVDISPIERTLNAYFPNNPENKKILAKAAEMAEVCRESNRFKRHDSVNYYYNGQRIMLTSGGFNFVSLVIPAD